MELAWVQHMLGIHSGGADALIALSLLSGGDYAIKGAEHVGARSAVRLVQHLLQDCQVHCLLSTPDNTKQGLLFQHPVAFCFAA